MRYLIILVASLGLMATEVAAKPEKKSGSNSRERVITREGRTKTGSKTKIDFEDTDIGGRSKTPYGDMLSTTKANKDYDLVQIRTDWRPEMLQSATSLDAGRAK